jgi:hypothetical protein
MLPFARVAIIGMGLIGASLARAIRQTMPNVHLTVSDGDAGVRARVVELDLADDVTENAGAAVIDAELVILAVPVGAMRAVAAEIADDLPAGVIITDVGSVKARVLEDLTAALPGVSIVPGHPVAGTEKSGPDAGFASLFKDRWSILTPERCVHWDRSALHFSAGAIRGDAPAGDAMEDLWRDYYSSIFNPARLKVAAMVREMPKRYWKNLPEAQLIPGLIREATARHDTMVERPPAPPRRRPTRK